jgi:hypothetical protein
VVLQQLDALTEFYRTHAQAVLDTCRIQPRYRMDEQGIAEFEAELGALLPADYRMFLLHNEIAHGFSGNFRCLEPVAVRAKWAFRCELLRKGTFDGWVERMIASG